MRKRALAPHPAGCFVTAYQEHAFHVRGATHLLRRPLSELQVDLSGARFVRIHRSVIVSLDRIRALELHAEDDYEVVLKSGELLRLSRRFRRSLQERLGQPLGYDSFVLCR